MSYRTKGRQRGATTTEYIIIVALIAIAAIAAVSAFGESIAQRYAQSREIIEHDVDARP